MLLPNRRLVIPWQALEKPPHFLSLLLPYLTLPFTTSSPSEGPTILSNIRDFYIPFNWYLSETASVSSLLPHSPTRPHLASWSHKSRTKLPTCLQRSPPHASTWAISLVTVCSCRFRVSIFALPTLRPRSTHDTGPHFLAHSPVQCLALYKSGFKIRDGTAHTYWHFNISDGTR